MTDTPKDSETYVVLSNYNVQPKILILAEFNPSSQKH